MGISSVLFEVSFDIAFDLHSLHLMRKKSEFSQLNRSVNVYISKFLKNRKGPRSSVYGISFCFHNNVVKCVYRFSYFYVKNIPQKLGKQNTSDT